MTVKNHMFFKLHKLCDLCGEIHFPFLWVNKCAWSSKLPHVADFSKEQGLSECCHAKFERGFRILNQTISFQLTIWRRYAKLKFRTYDNDMRCLWAITQIIVPFSTFTLWPPLSKNTSICINHGGPRTFLRSPGTLLAIGGWGGQMFFFWWKRCWLWKPHWSWWSY